MRRASSSIVSLLVLLFCLASSQQALAAKPAGAGASEMKRYLVQYPDGNADAVNALIASVGGSVIFDYEPVINGLAADLDRAGHRTLRRSGLATSIQEDGIRKLHALPSGFPLGPFAEFVPWGADRVGADALWSTVPNHGPADDNVAEADVAAGSVIGSGAVVGVLDSGADFAHPDLAGQWVTFGDGKIRDFLDGDDDPTDSAGNGHGTSVASNIASADNEVGVIGVAPGAKISPYRVCDEVCPLSAIIGGLVRATLDGVDVINMSFGGTAGFNLESSAIQAANQQGIVLVASAGNEATQKPSFPAAYDTVIAVGATDINDNPASFTNIGGWVDVTGPGVDVAAATCTGCGRLASLAEVSPTAQVFQTNAMAGTGVTTVTNVEIVDAGRGCDIDGGVTGANGKVALIVRGACSFAEKVANAEADGAVGTVVYNSAPDNFFGTLGDFTATGPAVSISGVDGATLVAEITAGTTKVDLSVVPTDYELVSGTSFSGPHVAGVAALIKSVNPDLSPIEVRKIIDSTAEPLGHNLIFANGMVRADSAVSVAQ